MRKILLGVVLAFLFSGTAQAGVYIWKDDVHGFTISLPDSWNVQTKSQPTMRLRVAAPDVEDAATCTVKAQKDGRLNVYPHALLKDAVNATLDRRFWEQEGTSDYEGAQIRGYLGAPPESIRKDAPATAVRISFVQDSGHGKTNMYGEMIGSVYGGMRYIIGCSSRAAVFAKYAPLFGAIISSAQLDEKYNPYATGYYRNFLADAK